MTAKLKTTGLDAAADFPTAIYHAVNDIVVAKWTQHPLWPQFASAWNAVGLRFHAADECASEFAFSLQIHGTSPPPPDRYRQERVFFDFFGASVSCLDSTFYALHAMAAFLKPLDFPMATEIDQRRATPRRTVSRFLKNNPSHATALALSTAVADPRYSDLHVARNYVTHRAAPARVFNVGDPAKPAAEWKVFQAAINANYLAMHRTNLVALLLSLVSAAETFAVDFLK